jgi:polyprenyl-phospho-N-acetylgalactosaminyl synthase
VNSELQKNTAVVIPSYNEGERVLHVVSSLLRLGFGKIIVVDDGSTDHSMNMLRTLPIVILHHPVNRGAGAATETGFEYCRRTEGIKYVITIDADTQHDPNDAIHMLEDHVKNNADITIGNRLAQNHNKIPLNKRYYNLIANLLTSLLSFKSIADSQSGFRVISMNVLRNLRIEHDQYEYCTEMIIKARKMNLKIISVPITTHYSEELKHKGQTFEHGVSSFFNLIRSTLFKNN